MGKGYKRKTRWRTLNIGAPPGEEDEEDGIKNGYTKGQENGTSSRNGPSGHKTGRTDSAGSTTSDYASDYASAASRSRRDDSGGSPSQPKIIFNENEYTRITTPRQDVLFKKGYLSRKKVWASTASTSATPSTTESQSASHSTADGSETTEDQQLLDCKENGAEEYPAMMEHGAQVAYGTFYDHTSGYYYEYPVMVVGPGPGMIGGSPMHNVLTAVPCGPVPLRPIEWVNPAFVPKLGNEQYCVMDYQTAQLGQYPTLVDENGVPLTVQSENTNGSDEPYHENGNGSTSWTGSVADEEQSGNNDETQNGTRETSSANDADEVAQAPENSEVYLETALAQQLHVTHVAVPPIPEPYVYPGHYMFGPSLINVNGVTIQSGPMVRNTGITGGPTNNGACGKRRKKKKLSRRKSRRPLGPDNAEDEEQEEEEYSSEAEHLTALGQPGAVNEAGTTGVATADTSSAEMTVTTSQSRPLNPECQEFRPVFESRIVLKSNEVTSSCETTDTDKTNSGPSSSGESIEKEQKITGELKKQDNSSIVVPPLSLGDEDSKEETKNSGINAETLVSRIPKLGSTEKLASRQSEEIEAAPVDFAAEVFANVTTMAERALAPRSVVEGTPMETEIGLDATSVNFQDIVENLEIRANENSQQQEDAARNGMRLEGLIDEEILSNGLDERRAPCEKTVASDQSSDNPAGVSSATIVEKHHRDSGINEKRGSRSASPGMINRITTPINANSQRLPESYESLVTRGTSAVSCSLPSLGTTGVQSQTRNRKYSSKAPKFVREATPGPDLDDVQSCVNVVETKIRNEKADNTSGGKLESTTRISRISSNEDQNDGEAIATGIEALESELQRYSLSTTEGSNSYAWEKRGNNPDVSNDDSGIESQTRFSSEHPITDAVTEWLQRANSPELFIATSTMMESEPEDDELENEEPPKNLQGNPMPALSANCSDVKNTVFSRSASFGKFASFIEATEESTKEREIMCGTNENINLTSSLNNENVVVSRKKRRADYNRRTTKKDASVEALKISYDAQTNDDAIVKNSIEAARQRLLDNSNTSSSSSSSTEVEKKMKTNEVCELTENDSVAGMRVAKSSRTKKNIGSIASTTIVDSCKKNHGLVDKTRRSRRNDKINNKITVMSSRDVPIENVEIKVRRMTGDENDEGIVEDEDFSVSRTFEKGHIVVSVDGKVLPVDNYQPILLKNNDTIINDRIKDDERIKFTKITCEKSQRDETSESEDASKRNSLGSIEEPDVLECWEVETVEPITTPKRIQPRGTSLEGEDPEDDNVDRTTRTTINPAGMEIVNKYYRLEAMRDSGTSVTSIDDDSRDNENNISVNGIPMVNNPDNMIESISSDDIPVIGERMNKIVEIMLERSGIPIDEAVEVYESCYGVKQQLPYLIGFDPKHHRRNLYGQDTEREGAVPCKAACCIIQ